MSIQPASGIYTKQVVSTYLTIFPTAGASKKFYAKIVPATEYRNNGFVYDLTGAVSVSVKPGSSVQYNKYSGIGFTLTQTLQPNTEYFLYFLGVKDSIACYANLTAAGTPNAGVSITLTN